MNSLISTKKASEILNISVRRVQALIAAGRLPAHKIGNSYAINESDLKTVSARKNGRPVNGAKPDEKNWDQILDLILGRYSFGPPDLSTNKKHMEGYGRD